MTSKQTNNADTMRPRVAFKHLDDEDAVAAKALAKQVSPFPKWEQMYDQDHPAVSKRPGKTKRYQEPFEIYYLNQPDHSGFCDLFVFLNKPHLSFALQKVPAHPTFVRVWKPGALEPLPGWHTNSDAGVNNLLAEIDSQIHKELNQ
jgi:hypothetical protein